MELVFLVRVLLGSLVEGGKVVGIVNGCIWKVFGVFYFLVFRVKGWGEGGSYRWGKVV